MDHFTADLHIGHTNILEYSKRPFKNIQEMNEALVDNWNKQVLESDTVFILGDFALCPAVAAIGYLRRIKGRKVLVKGNHDKGCLKSSDFRGLFFDIQDVIELTTPSGTKITLHHFAMRVWNKSHHGALHLHGHSHGSLPPLGKSVDVGVDSPYITGKPEYRPFSLEEIYKFMETRNISVEDHHGQRPGGY